MKSVFVLFFRSKSRPSDDVRSQPWQVDSVWEDEEAANEDFARQAAEHTSFDFYLETCDYYKRGAKKES
jgi:hypothetical protein